MSEMRKGDHVEYNFQNTQALQRMANVLDSYKGFYEVLKTTGLEARPPWDAAAEAATELASRVGAAMSREVLKPFMSSVQGQQIVEYPMRD
eukprot:3596258-Pyramimonas_sp.AAC.1